MQRTVPPLIAEHPALILKASGDAIHHGGLGVARTLGRLGVPVYAVVAGGCTPLSVSSYVRKSFIWKSWPEDRASYLHAMSEIGKRFDRRIVLFSMDDLSAIYAGENAIELSPWFILPHVEREIPRRLADKTALNSLCRKAGIPIARSVVASSLDDALAFTRSSKFPVVVKAAKQWDLLHGRFSAQVVRSVRDLTMFYEGMHGSESIVQEYIEGEDWISHGYYNSKSGLRVTFTGRKLLSYPAGAGSTARGLSIPNDTLQRQTECLLQSVCYSGIVDIDWRRDKVDRQYKMLDCNPRVGQNFRMFENRAGIDVVRAQYLDLTGQKIQNAPMVAGRLFSVESFSLLSLLRGTYHRHWPSEEDAPTPRADTEFAWMSREDPLPVLIMGVRFPLSLIRRACRRVARRFRSVQYKLQRRAAPN